MVHIVPYTPNMVVTYQSGEFGGSANISAAISEVSVSLPPAPVSGASIAQKYAHKQTVIDQLTQIIAQGRGFQLDPVGFQVKVPDLEMLPKFADVHPSFGSGRFVKVGGTAQHKGATDGNQDADPDNNHWGRPTTHHAVYKISDEYDQVIQGGPFSPAFIVLRINDMSLPFGGRFDVKDPAPGGQWEKNAAHRIKFGHANGRAVDITFKTFPSSMDRKDDIRTALINEAFTQEPFDPANPDASQFKAKGFFDEGDHFHVMR